MPAEWNEGAVAFLDALGFKGIWKNNPLQDVLDRLHIVERTVRSINSTPDIEIAKGLGFRLSIAVLSDSIVTACADPRRPDAAVAIATAAAGYAIHAAATEIASSSALRSMRRLVKRAGRRARLCS